jgi:signal transduction histidine kinase
MRLDVVDAQQGPRLGRESSGAAGGRALLRVVPPANDDASDSGALGAKQDPEEINLRIMQPLFRYVREKLGEDRLRELVEACGLPEGYLDRAAPWVSHERVENVLRSARDMMSSDAEFMQACAYQMTSTYGPMLLVLRTMKVRTLYDLVARTSGMVSKVSRFEVIGGTRSSVVLRYRSDRPESRLMCLSRQAAQRTGPALWSSTAPALLEERSCIAHGDACCEYVIKWHEPLRIRLAVVLALIGTIAATLVAPAIGLAWLTWIMLPLVGASIGMAIELRRTLREYQRFSQETARDSEKVVEAHARAVDEVLALHERSQRRNEELELQVEERAAKLNAVVTGMKQVAEHRLTRLRSLTHDLRNPLTALRMVVEILRREAGQEKAAEEVELIKQSVEKMLGLVEDLGALAVDGSDSPVPAPQPVDVADLSERIRRQLRATVTGRDIRVSVFKTREAPLSISVVRPLLERLVDNLLTNAAKYTDRGSIVVEVSGAPGALALKISDTGRGISHDRIEQIFLGGQADANPAIGDSRGFGLGIVARLLDQLDGRLEIMSEPGVGTTLWIYVPVEPAPRGDSKNELQEPLDGVVRRVVKVRSRPN